MRPTQPGSAKAQVRVSMYQERDVEVDLVDSTAEDDDATLLDYKAYTVPQKESAYIHVCQNDLQCSGVPICSVAVVRRRSEVPICSAAVVHRWTRTDHMQHMTSRQQII